LDSDDLELADMAAVQREVAKNARNIIAGLSRATA